MPCQKTRAPAAPISSRSETKSLMNPPMNAPAKAGIPITSTMRRSTRPSLKCRIAPLSEARLDTSMLVPPAIGALIPIRSIAGRRMVPSASPTNPPSIPTANETAVSTPTCQIRRSVVISCCPPVQEAAAFQQFAPLLLTAGRNMRD